VKKQGEITVHGMSFQTLIVASQNRPTKSLARFLQRSLHIPHRREIPPKEKWPERLFYPFLFIAENHALTAFACEHTAAHFPSRDFFLIVLDAHLDIFTPPENPQTLHRGNFLRYLLTRKIVTEETLLVAPLEDPLPALKEGLRSFGEGVYYLSWDIDFGFPQYAFFPATQHLSFSTLGEIFHLLGSHLHKKNRYLVGMDIVEINGASLRYPAKVAFEITTLLQHLHPQKIPITPLPLSLIATL
jgi:arginase family enzyme